MNKRFPETPTARAGLTALAACLLAACTSLGQYVAVEEYAEPPTPADAGYLIAPGDVLSVRVFNQDAMSARVRVRTDGKVSLPFLNDVEVVGQSPAILAQQLQVKLKEFIKLPVVTVSLEEPARLQVTVIGEVGKTGVYSVDPGAAGLLDALALAGGLTDFAHKDRIFVLRGQPRARIRFSFEALTHVEGKAGRFHLREGDVVVVE